MKTINCRIPAIFGIILFVSLTACFHQVTKLRDFKEHYNSGDFAWLVEEEVTCKASDEGCNQIHLLKGDACYREARQGRNVKKYFACASAHLAAAIDQTKDWQKHDLRLKRPQAYTNLCESLRSWRDEESGDNMDALNRRLLLRSEEFLSAEPGNVAAMYFLSNGRYAQLRKCLLHPENCPQLCSNLKEISDSLQTAKTGAAGTKDEPAYDILHATVLDDLKEQGCQ